MARGKLLIYVKSFLLFYKVGVMKVVCRDFPGGAVVKNPPANAEDTGSIPGRGTKIPHAAGQLSPRATTTEPVCSGAHEPQLERSPRSAMKSLRAATKTQRSQK